MPILSAFGAARAIGGPVAGSSGIQQGEYSYSFNGTNSSVVYPYSTSFTTGTQNFTVEFWVYITANPGSGVGNRYAIFSLNDNSLSVSGPWGIGINSTGTLSWRYVNASGTYSSLTSSISLTLNQWNFCAVSRSGTDTRIFINGTLYGTRTEAVKTLQATNTPIIGRCGSTNYLNGQISNLRYRLGTGITSSTVPTSPLQDITDTKLLTCRNSTIIDNSTANSGSAWSITSSNVTVQASSPYYP